MSISQRGLNIYAKPFYPPGYIPNRKKVSDLIFPVIDEEKIQYRTPFYRTPFFPFLKEQWCSIEPTKNKIEVLQEFIEYIQKNIEKYKDNDKILSSFNKSLHTFFTWLSSERLNYTDFDLQFIRYLHNISITRIMYDNDCGDQISISTTKSLYKKKDIIEFSIKNKEDTKEYLKNNYCLYISHSENWFRNPIHEKSKIKDPICKNWNSEWCSFFYYIKNHLDYNMYYTIHKYTKSSFTTLVKYLFLQTLVQDEEF